ncbi:MAG: 5-formyltetrahydrofolate cyclo-ligase [Spirochaetaceae bacterium]|jgi:5-formyltetrahydrofolate cyclo-ligase|nr:5-formyltetrahydrofolate cyclo-ligase [Spirochaetaceae bacterium]
MSKQAMRREITKLLRALPPGVFREAGVQAISRIRGGPFWQDHQRILFFLSTGLEIDTAPLMEAAFSDKKEVYAPKVMGESLLFYRIYSPAGPWYMGAFNIREPAAVKEEDALKPGEFLVLVPGLAFDPQGGRLGHGKGYYDRFFTGLDVPGVKTGPAKKNHTALGLCLEAQIVPQVPTEPWDKPMDALCTGSSFRNC